MRAQQEGLRLLLPRRPTTPRRAARPPRPRRAETAARRPGSAANERSLHTNDTETYTHTKAA